jgi:glycosyltransferase involved in cell wall biosynthesis
MIVIVSKFAPPDHSGAGKRMYSFFQYLKTEGYEVRFVTNTKKNEDALLTIKIHPVEKYGGGSLSSALTFAYTYFQLVYRYLVGNFKSTDGIRTVWLVSSSPLAAAAAVFFNLLGYKIVTQNVLMHSDDPARRPSGLLNLTHKMRLMQYYLSDRVTSNSPGLYELSKAHHPNCVMIPNPVEIPEINDAEDKRLRRNILIVGRLSYRKGADIVFKTIDIIHRTRSDIKFTFVGPYEDMDSELRWVYNSCENINRDNVHFAGYQQDPRPWFTDSDLFFLPSRKEGFPSVYIEAMAHGLPAVVKKLEGVTDYIFQNGYPAVIDSEDPVEYATEITRLIDDDHYYHSLVKDLRSNVTRFERQMIYNQYMKLIIP